MTKSCTSILAEIENRPVVKARDADGHNDKFSPTASSSSALPQQSEAEPRIWRGVFTPVHRWTVLFSQQIKIQTVELPRLKPEIVIDRRILEDEMTNEWDFRFLSSCTD